MSSNEDEDLTYTVKEIRNEDGSVTQEIVSTASQRIGKIVHRLGMLLGNSRQSNSALCRRYGIRLRETEELLRKIGGRMIERGEYLNATVDDVKKVAISEDGVAILDYAKLALDVFTSIGNRNLTGVCGYDEFTVFRHRGFVLSAISIIAEIVLAREPDFELIDLLRYLATADLNADREILARLFGAKTALNLCF